MVDAVEAFGGTVKDLAGDGILALFGAPITHEDDAERAIRAARLPHRSGRPRVAAAARRPCRSASVSRPGLWSLGPIGGGSRIEYGATGNALNTAARLQSHAPSGGVLRVRGA